MCFIWFSPCVHSCESEVHASWCERSCKIHPKERKGVGFIRARFTRSILVLAANIYPMDVISHIPVLCEENKIPYIFVSSKVATPPPIHP